MDINKSFILRDEKKFKMFCGSIRGGIWNAIYGFQGNSGKTNKSMSYEARRKGSISMWFSNKYDRDEALSFLNSTLYTPNDIVKRIYPIKKR